MEKLNRKKIVDDLLYAINGAAIEVHRHLGPGLLESVYHKALIHELRIRKIDFKSEVTVPVKYKGSDLEANLRCDLIAANTIVIELKIVQEILPVHIAQALTYMKLLYLPRGVIYNFNTVNLSKSGKQVLVNEIYSALPD